jgi:ATP-dependent DNA helicase DinG
MQIYAQERNLSPDTLVSLYKHNPKAIILGNQSMGTGVDIRIRGLVVTKIPFEQQSPYKDARQKFLQSKGVNPFYEDTLPDTVRKWKQWWGRLIREEDQKGLLVMLDPKLNTASYGKTFIKALPAGAKATHLDDPGYPLPTHDQFMQWIGLAPSAVAPPPVPEEPVLN